MVNYHKLMEVLEFEIDEIREIIMQTKQNSNDINPDKNPENKDIYVTDDNSNIKSSIILQEYKLSNIIDSIKTTHKKQTLSTNVSLIFEVK